MRYYNVLTILNFLLYLGVNVLQTSTFIQLSVDFHSGTILPRTGFTNDGEEQGD